MKDVYETKITNARWIVYDIFGNIGWISYIVCVIIGFFRYKEDLAVNVIGIVPAAFMLAGIIELLSERIAKLDRILTKARLFRGFGAIALGGALGFIFSLVLIIINFKIIYLIMLIGSGLCFVFVGLLFWGYKKVRTE